MNHKYLKTPQKTMRSNLTSEKVCNQELNKIACFPFIINLPCIKKRKNKIRIR